MLTRLELQHFKCFALLKLPLSPLTLLSGANASGKSSAIQALVLLHQTVRDHEWSTRLMLNGTAVRLGTVSDVIDQVYGRRRCGVVLLDDAIPYEWVFVGERDEMSMGVERVHINGSEHESPEILRHLLPLSREENPLATRLRNLTYLTAERLGPRESLHVGGPATYTCYWLDWRTRHQHSPFRPRRACSGWALG